MNQNEFVYKQPEENVEWSGKLDSYSYEIKLLQDHLEKVAQKNKHNDVLMVVEKFQNQLTLCRNTLDQIKEKLNEENHLALDMTIHPATTDHLKAEYHQAELQMNQILEKIVRELSEEFKRFTSK